MRHLSHVGKLVVVRWYGTALDIVSSTCRQRRQDSVSSWRKLGQSTTSVALSLTSSTVQRLGASAGLHICQGIHGAASVIVSVGSGLR